MRFPSAWVFAYSKGCRMKPMVIEMTYDELVVIWATAIDAKRTVEGLHRAAGDTRCDSFEHLQSKLESTSAVVSLGLADIEVAHPKQFN